MQPNGPKWNQTRPNKSHLWPHELDFVPPIQQFSHLLILLRLKLWPLTFKGQFAECEWKQNFITKKTSYSDLDSQRWYKSPWIHLIWKHEALCHEWKLEMFKFGSDYQSDDENEIEIHFVDLSSDEDEYDLEIGPESG